jgi:chromate transporter
MQDTHKSTSAMSLVSLAAMNAKIGLMSFGGGVTGLFYHELVTKRRALTDQEFLSALTVAQMLPGANVVNIAVFFGQKLHGVIGATVSVLALIAGPFFAVIGFYAVYDRLAGFPTVAGAIQGLTAAAIGMLACIALRGFAASPNLASHIILIATTVLVGILRLPLIPVVLCIAPASIALAALRIRRNG